jgi:hypothetical protein
MQTLTIDLVKEPEIKDLTASMQPGDLVDLHTSIKSIDDQTLVLTINEAEEGKEPEETTDGDGGTDTDDETDPNDERSPQGEPGASPLLGGSDVTGAEQAQT